MKTILLSFILISLLACITPVNAQVLGNEFRMDPYAKKPIPLPHLREADIMQLKTNWRVIDLREKLNHPLYFPIEPINERKNLTHLIIDELKEGNLTAYAIFDDEFTIEMTLTEVIELTTTTEDIIVEQANGSFDSVQISSPIEVHSVKRYRIKEAHFFDNQRSVSETRMIGICPVQEKYDKFGEYMGEKPLFWIYYPEARYTFARTPMYNTYNDVEWRSMDDLFLKRRFSSYIYKTSNVYNRALKEYLKGVDILLEAQKIESQMFNYEQDLWEY